MTRITPIAPPAKAARVDLYGLLHKALRQAMTQSLQDLGALDVNKAEARTAVLDGVDSLLGLLRSHLARENDFVHTAIEARQPGGAGQMADEHLQQQEAICHLAEEARAVRNAQDEQRPLLAQRLYRHLAAFVGENLVHMHVEETRGNAALWALYDDQELVALHDRLVASIPPAERALVVRWSAQALSAAELAALLTDLRRPAQPVRAFD